MNVASICIHNIVWLRDVHKLRVLCMHVHNKITISEEKKSTHTMSKYVRMRTVPLVFVEFVGQKIDYGHIFIYLQSKKKLSRSCVLFKQKNFPLSRPNGQKWSNFLIASGPVHSSVRLCFPFVFICQLFDFVNAVWIGVCVRPSFGALTVSIRNNNNNHVNLSCSVTWYDAKKWFNTQAHTLEERRNHICMIRFACVYTTWQCIQTPYSLSIHSTHNADLCAEYTTTIPTQNVC